MTQNSSATASVPSHVASTALMIAAIAVTTILGAYYFEYFMKLAPCPLCLEQRIPYYVAIPLALAVALAAWRKAPRAVLAVGFTALAGTFLVSAALGIYHTGIEWKFWPGPAECSGSLGQLGAGGGLLEQMQSMSVVRCDEAPWRLFGISLAGYNVIISLYLSFESLGTLRRLLQGISRS